MQNARVYVMVVFIGLRFIHSPYISDLLASGPLMCESDGWLILGFGWLQWRLRQRSCCEFYLNGRKCDLLLLMQGVGSELLVLVAMFVHVCPHTLMYI